MSKEVKHIKRRGQSQHVNIHRKIAVILEGKANTANVRRQFTPHNVNQHTDIN